MAPEPTAIAGLRPLDGPVSTARAARTGRVTLRLFAIPLGLTGLAGAWSAATALLGAPRWPQEVGYAAGAALWIVLVGAYVAERARRPARFRADRQHPVDGPAAAQPPLIGILVTAHYAQFAPVVGTWACGGCIAALALVDAQLFAHWLSRGVPREAVHPGYFLPLVAGPFVASIGISAVGGPPAPAIAAFGVGGFFWLVIGGIVTARLITPSAPAPAVTPAHAVLLAPAATGGIAALLVDDGRLGPLQDALVGIFLVMLLIQLALLPEYRRLTVGLGFWTFTFPVASSAHFVIRWLHAVPGWPSVAWTALGAATAIVLGIAAATLPGLWRSRQETGA